MDHTRHIQAYDLYDILLKIFKQQRVMEFTFKKDNAANMEDQLDGYENISFL